MKSGFRAPLRAGNGIDWATPELAFVGILVVFPSIATTQHIQMQATDQEIENALRHAPAEPSPEPEFSEQEKK